MKMKSFKVDPSLDLLLEREVAVPREKVWRAWTEPELMVKWFTPAPWATESVEIDLTPGGIFKVVMKSPEGDVFDNDPGCILEVVENRKLVWTSALLPGYRPLVSAPGDSFLFTAVITLEDGEHGGTRYSALAIHADAEGCKKHELMGFHTGWGSALDQLVELMQS